jgi:hypothetical protein
LISGNSLNLPEKRARKLWRFFMNKLSNFKRKRKDPGPLLSMPAEMETITKDACFFAMSSYDME